MGRERAMRLRFAFLGIAAATLAGCSSAASKAEADYEFLSKNGGTDQEKCAAAGRAAQAWMEAHDAQKYEWWTSMRNIICQKVELDRQIIGG